MTGASPWSVKGIAAEERELAKQSARRAGLPIGKWLSRQIRAAAEQERRGRVADMPATADGDAARAAASPPVTGGATAAAWRAALAAPPLPSLGAGRDPDGSQQLEARLAALEAADRRLSTLLGEVAELGARIDRLEQRSDGQSAAVIRQMRSIGAEIDALRARPDVGDAASFMAPLEHVVARLGDRLQRVEELVLPEPRRLGVHAAGGRGAKSGGGSVQRPGLLGRLFRR